ncbi:MAG: DUF1848 domain-containing protein [Chloroflexi bacterium]|nr:DUF1848 domain-containing protein [Chloroflexota bacterium]
MIISASRRTDIPAFYAEWFMNRIREGYCTVPNPLNRNQVSYVSLHPKDVDIIVFWTRNPRPLLPYLPELKERGYGFYFQYTVMGNPREIDVKGPTLESALDTFRELSERVGPQKVIWRYDPIVSTQITNVDFHKQSYEHIAEALRGYTKRSVVSIIDVYRKAQERLRDIAKQGVRLLPLKPEQVKELMIHLVAVAQANKMQIYSCAEVVDLSLYGIVPGKCIDDQYIFNVFGIQVPSKKDPSQREACSCVVSKDIGMYDSCLFGCQYCYATSSFEQAKSNYAAHDPASPSLLGWFLAHPKPASTQMNLFTEDLDEEAQSLWTNHGRIVHGK